MTDEAPSQNDSPQDERFAEALEEYYRRRARGEVDPHGFASEFPEVRDELLAYLSAVEDIRQLAPTLPHTSQEPPTAPPRETIRYFGDYELLAEIARGGMGVVYRARQVSLNRMVAVKMILTGRLASEEDVARFRREAMGAARLRHPNVVTIYEIGEHEGQHFFSMEYVDGSNLAQLVRENPISGTRAAEYGQIIAETMSAVHREGLLHRDLKPSNVLIEVSTGRLRISDFGLVKTTDAAALLTTSGHVLGTPSYMAPEQAAGQKQLVGPASDIYAIGAILYELATGRPPFLGETPWDTAWQVCTSEVVAPRSLNPKVPRDLETVCLKCLQREITRRYATAQELADDLGRFLRNEPIHARPVGRGERAWRWCRRNPALSGALAAAAAGLLGLLFSLILLADTQHKHAKTLALALDISEQRRRESDLRLAENERDKGLRLCAQGDIDQGCLWLARSLATAPEDAAELRWSIRINIAAWHRELCLLKGVFPGEGRTSQFSRDGQRFVTTSSAQPYIVRVREIAGGLASPPILLAGPARDVQFGADDNTLLIAGRAAKGSGLSLWRHSDEDWHERVLADDGQIRLEHYQITSDNRVLVAESRSDGVVVRDAVANGLLGPPLPATSFAGPVILSPDGRLALTHQKNHRSLLTDLTTGKPVGSAMVHPGRVTAAAFSPDSQRLAVGCEVDLGNGRAASQAQIWQTASAAKSGAPLKHDEQRLEQLAFSATGERLFTATSSKLRVWDRSGKLLAGPLPHGDSRFRISDDGRLLAYITPGREARLWDVDEQRTIAQPLARRLDAHFLSDVPHVALAPDAKHVLTATPEGARLWETPQRARLSPLTHGKVNPEILWLDFSQDNRRLLSTSYAEGTARVWDVRRQEAVGKPFKAPYGIQCRAISPDGRWVAIGSMQGPNRSKFPSVSLWNVDSGESAERRLPKYEEVTHWLAFSHDGKLLVTVGDRGLVHVYDIDQDKLEAGPLQHPMSDVEGQHLFLLISPDDRRIAVHSRYDSAVSLWDFPTGKPICEPLKFSGRIYALAISPDSKMLAIVGNEIALYDVQTGVQLPVTIRPPAKASDAAISPDGKWLATVHEDRTARLWNTSSGDTVGRVLEHAEPVAQVAFTAEGKLLLTGTSGGGYLWEPVSGTQVGPTLKFPGGCATSPNGGIVAAAGGPEIRLWDVPQAVSDDGAEIMREIEAATALSLDEQRRIQPLSESEWQSRRKPQVPQP